MRLPCFAVIGAGTAVRAWPPIDSPRFSCGSGTWTRKGSALRQRGSIAYRDPSRGGCGFPRHGTWPSPGRGSGCHGGLPTVYHASVAKSMAPPSERAGGGSAPGATGGALEVRTVLQEEGCKVR